MPPAPHCGETPRPPLGGLLKRTTPSLLSQRRRSASCVSGNSAVLMRSLRTYACRHVVAIRLSGSMRSHSCHAGNRPFRLELAFLLLALAGCTSGSSSSSSPSLSSSDPSASSQNLPTLVEHWCGWCGWTAPANKPIAFVLQRSPFRVLELHSGAHHPTPVESAATEDGFTAVGDLQGSRAAYRFRRRGEDRIEGTIGTGAGQVRAGAILLDSATLPEPVSDFHVIAVSAELACSTWSPASPQAWLFASYGSGPDLRAGGYSRLVAGLVTHGFAVTACDDPGVGNSRITTSHSGRTLQQNLDARTFDTMATEALAVLATARRLEPQLADLPVGLVGHSQGAHVAVLAGSRALDQVSFVVAMGAPFTPTAPTELGEERVRDTLGRIEHGVFS